MTFAQGSTMFQTVFSRPVTRRAVRQSSKFQHRETVAARQAGANGSKPIPGDGLAADSCASIGPRLHWESDPSQLFHTFAP